MIYIDRRSHNSFVGILLIAAGMTAPHAQELARESTLIVNAQTADGSGAAPTLDRVSAVRFAQLALDCVRQP